MGDDHNKVAHESENNVNELSLSELEQTKAGLKQVVDTGISKVPKIFIYPKQLQESDSELTEISSIRGLQVPVIDLQGFLSDRRSEIVSDLLTASNTWGMFQLINHGVSQESIQQLLDCIKEFNEQPKELKQEYYTRDPVKKVQYRLSLHPVYRTGLWKDTITFNFENHSAIELEDIPTVCRKPVSDYLNCMTGLRDMLSELLSEALGLRSDYLEEIGCMEAQKLNGHYYPACPEPSLTMGTPKHSDPYFFTVLVHNRINGLQVLYEGQWINVSLNEGAILANIGDMLQLISNDIFKSAEHRVLASSIGPRVSVACFFCPSDKNKDRAYGPIKELLKGDVAPSYKATSQADYVKCFIPKGNAGVKALSVFRQ